MKFILTSPTGNLGSRVLHSILDYTLIPTQDLILSTTSPHKVETIAKQNNIPVITGDLTQRQELHHAYAAAAADALFLISFPGPSLERWEYHRNAIDAAVASATIKLIVYTSLMYGGKTGMLSVAGVQQAHIKTVQYLQQCGLDYVVIREGIYAQSWPLYAGFVPQPFKKEDKGEINFVFGKDGPIAWVSWDDLGEGTARVLAKLASGDKQWTGKTLCLTGPRTTTIAELVPLVEKWTRRKVNLKIAGADEAARYHLAKNTEDKREDWVIKSWAVWHEAIANGECAVVDPLLEEILGRKPRGIQECAQKLFSPV